MARQSTPPFPSSGAFIQSIRESSRSLRQASQIEIHPYSIKRLLLSPAFTSTFKRVSTSHGLLLPLKFTSHLDELNLLSVLSLLNFGSGYRAQLHAATGRGAWDTIRALVFSLYLTSSSSNDFLSARGMLSIDHAIIAELMGVNLHVETCHATIPGLTVGQLGGPMYELVKLITQVLNETGDILVKSGYPNLGSFVLEALREAERAKSDSQPNAALDIVLERLVRAFPAFQDMAEVDGEPIYCFKKALFLVQAVAIRFGSASPPPFPIPSTARCPVFTDNVVPSMLIHLGVIDLAGSVALSTLFPNAGSEAELTALLMINEVNSGSETVGKEGPILTVDQSYILRAAAVDACELIIDAAHSIPLPEDGSLDWIRDITLPNLDMWIWAIAKDRADYRMLERFALKDTVFF